MSHHRHHAMGSLGGIGYSASFSGSSRRHRVWKSDYQFSQMELVSLEPHVTSILMYTNTESNTLSMVLIKFDKTHEHADIYVYRSKPLSDNNKKTEKLAQEVAKAVGYSRESNHIRKVPVEDLKPLFQEGFLKHLANKDAKCIVAVINAVYPSVTSEDVDIDLDQKKEAWQYLINTKGMMALRGRQTQMYQELRSGQYINTELFFKKNAQGALEAKDWAKIKEENRYLYEPRTDAALQTFIRLDENLTEQHMKPIENLVESVKSSSTGKLDFSWPGGALLLYVMKQLDTRKINEDHVIADAGDSVAPSEDAL